MSKSKKVISVILAFVVMCLPIMNSSVFAMNTVQSSFLNEDTYSSDELYKGLIDIGFSDEEIMFLYQRESNQTGISFKLPKALTVKTKVSYVFPESGSSIIIKPSKFPSNPREGDVHEESIDINFDSIARALGWTGGGTGLAYILAHGSKRAVAKAIVASTGLGVFSAALSIAGLIFSRV